MAEILSFPARTPPSLAEIGDGWPQEDAPDGIGLGLVAALAAAPSRSLAELAHKAEVLVLRLLPPGDGADAGLCAAEAALLRCVARDLRRAAEDLAFALHDAGFLAPAAAE